MSYIGTQPVPQSLESRQEFTATASQTTFATNGYTVGYVDVYLNGVKLSTSDFTATNGSDVVLGSGAAAGDILAVVMKNDHSDLVALPITDSAGNNVLSESSGTVTLTADEANVGSNAFVVDSSGNVGVGTNSPNYLCEIKSAGSSILAISAASTSYDSVINFIHGTTVDGGITYDHNGSYASEVMQFRTGNNTTNMTLDGAGKLTIPASDQGIQIGPLTPVSAAYTIKRDSNGLLNFRATQTTFNGYIFDTVDGQRMKINSSGAVTINNLGSGDVYATSGTLYISSDIRLKNDLGAIDESGIEIIKQLTPRYYSWKEDENNRKQLGFFAQEVFPILPEAVPRDLKYEQNGVDENNEPILEQVLDENGEPDYQWGFATQPIVAMLVKAMQEQQTLIESQQSQIDTLTAKTQEQDLTIASLISRIEALETPAE